MTVDGRPSVTAPDFALALSLYRSVYPSSVDELREIDEEQLDAFMISMPKVLETTGSYLAARISENIAMLMAKMFGE